jgi:MscS family membrane protein
VYFYIETTDYSAELEAREGMLLRIMDLARELGIDFAFPTRTLVIEAPPDADVRHPREAFGAILGRR